MSGTIAPPPGLKPKVKIISNIPAAEKSKSNLSNSDFRRFLDSAKDSLDAGSSKVNEEDVEARQAKKSQSKKESYKRWQAKKAMLEEKYEKRGAGYRDRVQERNENKNPDYEGVEAYENIDIEQSKYLGGDVAHTHLVKGLDYALLEKMRSLTEKEEEDRLEKGFMEAKKEKEEKAAEEKKQQAEMKFVSHLGRKIYDLVITEKKARTEDRTVELFLPGRMTFEFDLDLQFTSLNSLPITQMQSKLDCPTTDKRVSGMVSRDIKKKIDKIMGVLGNSRGHKSRHKKGKKSAAKKNVLNTMNDSDDDDDFGKVSLKEESTANKAFEAPDDDDIFGGVGRDYNPEDGEQDSGKNMGDIFGTVQGPEQGPSLPPADYSHPYGDEEEDAGEVEFDYSKQEAALEEKQSGGKGLSSADKKRKEQEPDFVSDYYSECYPAYTVDVKALLDQENSDDDDLSKMDQGRSRKPVRPWDFENEQDWEKYNNEREANPSAAFQFGLKMKDGRKNKQKLTEGQKASNKQQKFDKEFNQLTQMMKKRGPKKGSEEDNKNQKRQRILKVGK